jgi:hypothetical protein
MATRNDAIAANIAARITRNKTRFRFSTLHRLAIEETQNMRNTSATTTGLQVHDTERNRVALQNSADANAPSEGTKPVAPNADAAGNCYTVGSQVTVGTIKPVDRKTITGSTPGDFRKGGDSVKDAMDGIANPPSPRQQMRGQQDGRNYNESGKAFQSTSNSPDSDAGD